MTPRNLFFFFFLNLWFSGDLKPLMRSSVSLCGACGSDREAEPRREHPRNMAAASSDPTGKGGEG